MKYSADMTEALIRLKLNDDRFSFVIEECVSSTNTVLKEMAENDAAEYTVLISDFQTGGRGRLGRSFFSPPGTGIYMSILLRPDKDINDSLLLTTCMAVCCARAIEKTVHKDAKIKWVNDIYVSERKVCGILTEGSVNSENGKLRYAVVGIGINVFAPKEGFPEDIKGKAGSLFEAEHEKGSIRSDIIAGILNEFIAFYPNISKDSFIDEYKSRSFLDNREIEVLRMDGAEKATALYVDDELRLVVKYQNGSTEALAHGDVSIYQGGCLNFPDRKKVITKRD